MNIKINSKSKRFSAIEISDFAAAVMEANSHIFSDSWPFNGEEGYNEDDNLSFKVRKIKTGWSITLWDGR